MDPWAPVWLFYFFTETPYTNLTNRYIQNESFNNTLSALLINHSNWSSILAFPWPFMASAKVLVFYYVSSTLSLLERQQCIIMVFNGSIKIDSQHSVFSSIREGLQPQSGSMWPCQQPGTGRGAGAERLPGVGAALCSIRRACVESPGAMQSQVSRWACDYYFQACLTWPLLHSVNSCFARFTETLHERPFFFYFLLRT